MAITAAQVKELRERTGAGMLDCKKALEANNGDIELAIDWLREKGISKAAKKSGRVAAEGLIFTLVSDDNKSGAILEFNSETDFVAKNDDFVNFGKKVIEIALKESVETVEELKAVTVDGKTVETMLTELIAKIGENMNIRRFTKLHASNDGLVVDYLHMGGKIGVLVNSKGEVNSENIEKLRGVAMHIAAMDPKFLDKSLVTPEDLEREEHVLRTQFEEEMKQTGKNLKPEVVENIIQGKLRKYYEENCLNQQKYVRDDKKVEDFLKPMTLVEFIRFKVGDGIEKKEEDFAAEVAAQIAGK
ncbi:translation elongation factor Ts [Oceanivirga miroungae]|uniref:Elongation factor Ts n=1 Tax=Oceanivirga miroungae TaxID=1130046 RepID=A0A6I8M8F8_9FUSO|nr:translation elongation factor Ts [Oceanivirga miroungae]VWL85751.1 elongation factor Ts [Oceanivirga miroungae]